MPGVILPYKLKTNLAEMIQIKRAKRVIELKRKVNIGEIENEICEFIGTKIDNLKQIKRGYIRPSILTALKMAQYFDCKVEELFFLEGDKNNVEKNLHVMR